MKDLERYLKETPKPHISPGQFRANLRRRLLNGAPKPRPWILKAEIAWLACLAVFGVLVLMVCQPQLAQRANSLVFGPAKSVRLPTEPYEPSLSPTALASLEQDRQMFEAWALSQGLDKAPEIKNQETERLVLRRFVLQDGRMVEVVSRQNDEDVQQKNVLY